MITSIRGCELVELRLQALLFRTHSRSIMSVIMIGRLHTIMIIGTRISQVQLV